MFGVFVSLDLMLYYGFWELSLVPMAILIAMYGRKDGPKAALKFFLFTFIPSAPLLVAILWLYATHRHASISPPCRSLSRMASSPPAHSAGALSPSYLPSRSRSQSSRCMAGSPTRSAKHPSLLPWSSPASWASTPCSASTSASSLSRPAPPLPGSSPSPSSASFTAHASPSLSATSGDCIAFAALSHLSLIVLGIYGFTLIGSTGAVFQILSHGVVDAALFLLLGSLYDRYSTSQINAYGGLAAKLPRTATLFVIATLAMIGLPMLSGFVGEFLVLSSTFGGVSRSWAAAAALGVILGAAYMLWLVQRLFYGGLSALTADRPAPDLGLGQLLVLCPLAVLMLVLGLAPNLWLPSIQFGIHPPQAHPLPTAQQQSLNFELNREVQQ